MVTFVVWEETAIAATNVIMVSFANIVSDTNQLAGEEH